MNFDPRFFFSPNPYSNANLDSLLNFKMQQLKNLGMACVDLNQNFRWFIGMAVVPRPLS